MEKHIKRFENFINEAKTIKKEDWEKFCKEYNITMADLRNKTYSVDTGKPVILKTLLKINADSMECDIFELEDYGFPLKEILKLETGEKWEPVGPMGADVIRIR